MPRVPRGTRHVKILRTQSNCIGMNHRQQAIAGGRRAVASAGDRRRSEGVLQEEAGLAVAAGVAGSLLGKNKSLSPIYRGKILSKYFLALRCSNASGERKKAL